MSEPEATHHEALVVLVRMWRDLHRGLTRAGLTNEQAWDAMERTSREEAQKARERERIAKEGH